MKERFDVVCFSHLRWHFVWQRPHRLLSRCAREHRVFFVEEPKATREEAHVEVTWSQAGIAVAVPHLPVRLGEQETTVVHRKLLDDLLIDHGVEQPVLWYYTPMALSFSRHLPRLATVYGCMDELSAFNGAPTCIAHHERELLEQARLVFTGGASLWEAKRSLRPDVHLFPSSVDAEHFAQSREAIAEPDDQALIGRPRLGFFGVIDERLARGLCLSLTVHRLASLPAPSARQRGWAASTNPNQPGYREPAIRGAARSGAIDRALLRLLLHPVRRYVPGNERPAPYGPHAKVSAGAGRGGDARTAVRSLPPAPLSTE